MAQVNAGRVRFVSKSEYNNETQYYIFDLVNYNGSSYYAKENTIGILPTNTTKWQLVAEKGNIGPVGPQGETGNGIVSVVKTSTSGLTDTYTITYTNGNTSTFTVTNGKGILSIVKTSTSGLVDTYTVTFNDNTTMTYTVTNGKDGVDGEVTQEQLDQVIKDLEYWKTTNNALPKVEGEGTDITLDNTADSPLTLGFKASENTQESTTGKQLLKIDDTSSNGVTYLNNSDGSVLLNGSNTNDINFYKNITLPAGTYYLNYGYVSGNITSENVNYFQLLAYSGNTQLAGFIMSNSNYTNNNNVSFTLTEETTVQIRLYIGSVVRNFSNFKFYFMLTKDNYSYEWEKFTGGQPSPSPDYPQDIHVVKGDNEVVIENKNLLNVVGSVTNYSVTSVGTADGKISSTGTTSARYFNLTPNYVPINAPAGDYIFSLKSAYPYGIQFMLYNADNVRIANETLSTGTISRSFNITENATYYRLAVVSVPESTVINTTVYPMLRTASVTDDTYVAQKEQNYPLNLGVENKFDKDNANILNAYINGTNKKIEALNTTKTLYISCKPNTTYTIQRLAGQRFIAISSPNYEIGTTGTNIVQNNTGSVITINTGNNDNYLCVFYYHSTYDTLSEQEILDSIQIEESSTAHSYSPYGQTPIEMCNINNYADEFFKNVPECEYYDSTLDYGKWYKLGKIAKIDSYNGETITTDYMSTTGGLDIGATVYYVLATPTKTLLSDTLQEQLDNILYAMAYQDQTNISQNNEDRPFVISASTVKDIKTLEDRITALEESISL